MDEGFQDQCRLCLELLNESDNSDTNNHSLKNLRHIIEDIFCGLVKQNLINLIYL